MNRQEKEAMVAELRDKLERSRAAILTDYCGLKVMEITELRHKLKEDGVEYRVVKNSLIRLAVKDTEASPLADFIRDHHRLGDLHQEQRDHPGSGTAR